PRRVAPAEAQLAGRAPEPAIFRAAADAAATAIDPLTDVQTDAVYRRELVAVVTRRALEQAGGGTGILVISPSLPASSGCAAAPLDHRGFQRHNRQRSARL